MILLGFFPGPIALSQGCAQASGNQLCADDAPPTDSLEAIPVNAGCIDVSSSYYYSFHTNDVADLYSASIAISHIDCDNPIGPDMIEVMVVAIPEGADPCDPTVYQNAVCGSDIQSFTLQLNLLLPNQDYLVIVGSDHDPSYGPCLFSVDISGDAVDLIASANPPYVTLGGSSQLNVVGSDVAVNWTNQAYLDDPASTSPVATPEVATTFTVTGEVDGCVLYDIVSVEIGPPIVIYNTFTPNGDVINDTWTLSGIQRFPNCQVNVFDRWGQNVFKSTGYAKPWDGTYKGNFLPTAAYYYVIELNSADVRIAPLTGTISIVH